MTLKELKKMIAEEYSAYTQSIKEEPAGGPAGGPIGVPTGGPAEPTIAVSDNDIDATGGDENAEETLRDIFNMLKDFFEPKGGAMKNLGSDSEEDETPKAPKAPKAPKKDGGEDKEGGKKEDEEEKEDDKEKEALQERFKKLAGIAPIKPTKLQ